MKFDSADHYFVGVNPDDSGKVSYARTTPVLGVLFKLAPRWNVYANYGEGFGTPTLAELAYRPLGATGLNFALQPATSRHAEFGVKGMIGGSTRINAALFRIDTRNEIVTNSSTGGRSDFRNASRTQRDGLELSFESVLPSGFQAGIEYRASQKVYVNEANTDAAAGYGVANVRAGFQQQFVTGGHGNWRISEFVRVDNMTGHRYIGSVIVAEARGRYFEPAPGRNVLVGLNAAYSF